MLLSWSSRLYPEKRPDKIHSYGEESSSIIRKGPSSYCLPNHNFSTFVLKSTLDPGAKSREFMSTGRTISAFAFIISRLGLLYTSIMTSRESPVFSQTTLGSMCLLAHSVTYVCLTVCQERRSLGILPDIL